MPSLRQGSMRVFGGATALLMLWAASLAALPAHGATVQSAQQQATAARKRLDSMRTELGSGLTQYRSASADLAKTRASISASNKRLAEIDVSLKSGQARLGKQVQFLYRTDGTGFVDVLLGSRSFEEFAGRLYVLSRISSDEAALIARIRSERAEARRLRADLKVREERQAALVRKVGRDRASSQAALDKQQRYLDSLSDEVAALLAEQERARDGAAAAKSASRLAAPKVTVRPKTSVALAQATVAGRPGTYYVMASEPRAYKPTGVGFTGVSTTYGNNDAGGGTASGRPFNENELTCAHRTLPFGTRLAVTKGSKRVIVVVTDRGPYTKGRVLDVSRRAAKLLGLDGVGTVKCEIVVPG